LIGKWKLFGRKEGTEVHAGKRNRGKYQHGRRFWKEGVVNRYIEMKRGEWESTEEKTEGKPGRSM